MCSIAGGLYKLPELEAIAQFISREIPKRLDWPKGIISITVESPACEILLHLDKVTVIDLASERYLVRMIESFLNDLGMRSEFTISGKHGKKTERDFVFDASIYTPKSTSYQQLLKDIGVSDESIPEEFLCSLTKMIIDNPVYIASQKDIKFDEKQLRLWVFKQDTMENPFNRQAITLDDIIHDYELEVKIKKFVASAISNRAHQLRREESKEAENAPLLERVRPQLQKILSKYKLPNASRENLHIALRKAAAADDGDSINILLLQGCDINDTGQGAIRRTAMHWAIIKESVNAVRILKSAKARTDIQDSKNKTPIDYAMDNSNPPILKILGILTLRVDGEQLRL